MITFEQAEESVMFLHTSAPEIAKAKHDKVRTEEMRKAVLGKLKLASPESAQAGKEAWAYAQDAYEKAVEEMADAAGKYELLLSQRKAAEARIDAWRSMNATHRSVDRRAA